MSDMDNLPDFDNMSPEEIQLWMESLAKRQGASEGLLTNADMEIAEIDPDSVVIDEPGYVPSESFTSSSAKKQEAAPPVAPPPTAQVTPPAASFDATPSGRGTGERVRLPTEPPPPRTPITQQAPAPIEIPQEESLDETLFESAPVVASTPQPVEGGGLAWLESLAADQDDGFELDFASLSETAFPDETPQLSANPESWLDDLVSSGGELEEAIEVERPSARVSGAFIEEKPRWMDSDDESEEIELPDIAAVDQDDPEGWLRSLSAAEGYDEDGVSAVRPSDEEDITETHETESVSSLGGIEVDDETLAEIKRAIAEGRVSSDQMQLLLDYQTDILAQQPDTEIDLDDFYDPDAPPEKAVIPDWLLESAGVPPNLDGKDSSVDQGNTDLINLLENDAVQSNDMTDWLKSDESVDFQSIFADEVDTEAATDETPLEFEIDETDSWGEAFELERNQNLSDLDSVPDWYEQNLNDPARIAAVEEIEVSRLNEAALPTEDQLQEAERVDVPDWLQDISEQQGEVTNDVPSWMLEAEQVTTTGAINEDIPGWLAEVAGNNSYDQAEETPVVQEPVVITPVQPVAATQPKPTPAPPKAPAIDVPEDIKEALAQAREFSEANDVPSGLSIYEALIRHSVLLDDVVGDLQSLKRKHRENPAVYRVLGDGLMRQGNLQAALDTYRDALNHL